MDKLIEVKTPKATLLLTEDEYLAALKRGKAIKRSRELKRRLEPKDNQAPNYKKGYSNEWSRTKSRNNRPYSA